MNHIEAYKKYKSLVGAARSQGVTKQAIFQVVNKSNDSEVIKIRNRIKHLEESCAKCEKSFKRIGYYAKGFCKPCYMKERKKKLQTR